MDAEEARRRQWLIDRETRRVFAANMRARLNPPAGPASAVREAWLPIRALQLGKDKEQAKDVDSERFNFGYAQDEKAKGTRRLR